MIRRPPRSTRTDTLFPYTTLFRPRTTVTLSALEPNLAASLDLMADIIKNPAFAPSEIERLRAQQLAGIASELTQPTGIALRTLPPLLYGEQHPYGTPFTGSGHAKAVDRKSVV